MATTHDVQRTRTVSDRVNPHAGGFTPRRHVGRLEGRTSESGVHLPRGGAGSWLTTRALRFVSLLALAILMAPARHLLAQASAGYSEYIIPANEGAASGDSKQIGMWYIFDALDDIANPGPTNMHTVISVTAWAPNTTIYYDHHEDGLDFDPNNPATADETIVLTAAGQRATFESANFSIPRPNVGTCSPVGTCVYDGGDRIYVAGGAVTVTRASWEEARQPGNQAVAWEIYPVKPQLTTYVLPFGEDLGGTYNAFQRVYVLIQATANGTTFTVDYDPSAGNGPDLLNVDRNATKGGGSDATTISLNAGETFVLDRISACVNGSNCTTNPGNLPTGVVVQGSSTLQVKFVVGRVASGYTARGLSAFPRGYWTKDYYAPVNKQSAGSDVDYFLHNPHGTALTINWQSRTTSGSFSIPAGSTVSYMAATGGTVPTDSGLYFSASDVFWGVGIGDTGSNTYEWGYSLLPSTLLYKEHFLGWAPGSVPVDATGAPGDKDDVGVFLTVAQDNTRVYVDFNGDGVPDLIDADLNGTPESPYVTLDRLQTQYFYDPNDGDLSGAHFWATGNFTMAYGENAARAPAAAPSMDLGYVAIPGTDFISLVFNVTKSASPQVVPTASGSTTTFTVVAESREYPLNAVRILDILPPNWTYQTGVGGDTTTITLPNLTTISTNPTVTAAGAALPVEFGGNCPAGGGPCLTWGTAVLGSMQPNQQITISYTARTTSALIAGTLSLNRVEGTATRTFGSPAVTQSFSSTDFAYITSGNLQITKTSNAPDPLYPGDAFTYTVTVTNPSGTPTPPTQTNVALYDPIPAGVRYVGGSGLVTGCSRALNVRDQFASVAYTNNNGNVDWAGPWAETDTQTAATAGPESGFVRVDGTNGRLQFRYYATSTVRDDFGSQSYGNNNGTDYWVGPWVESTALDGVATNAVTNEIFVNTGTGRLRFRRSNSAATFYISRTASVRSGSTVTVSFTPYDVGIGAGEAVRAEYQVDGAGGFTALGTFDGSGNPAGWSGNLQTYTINSFPGSAITLRFIATGAWTADTDIFEVDGVQIQYTNAAANAVGSQIVRTAPNLTGATSVQLNFTYTGAGGLAATDTMVVEVSDSPTGTFTTLASFAGATPSVAPPYTISAPNVSATTTVRFRVTGGYANDGRSLSFDNVDIGYTGFSSGSPPDFLPASAGCSLAAGASLTLTFRATVDDPFLSGQSSVTNTAAATSSAFPVQIIASRTDRVVTPSVRSATVAGRLWLDADADGIQDVGEPGLANVEVTLKDQYGTPIATTSTNGNGQYLFTAVAPGNGYYVEATNFLPGGLSQTFPSGRTDNRTNSFNVSAGQDVTGRDMGFRTPAGTAAFGDLVWVDSNQNGIRDLGEAGLGGVAVRLYRDANANGSLDVLTDTFVPNSVIGAGTVAVTNGSNTVTGTSTQFVTLAAGDPIVIGGTTYTINTISNATTLTLTANYTGTTSTNVGYTAASTPGTGTVTATAGSATVTGTGTSFSTYLPGDPIEIQGRTYRVQSVTNDTSLTLTANIVAGGGGTNVPFGVPSLTVSDVDGSYLFTGAATGNTYFVSARQPSGYAATTTTTYGFPNVAAGSYLSADFGFRGNGTPTYSLSDRVWLDANGNGAFDGGENGIGGVTVDLLDSSLNVIGTTTTSANGTFAFSGLVGNGADYTTRITDTAGVLAGFNGTTSYARANRRSEPNLTANRDRTTPSVADGPPSFGYLPTRAIGDTVFYDINGNGVQDAGENGIQGVVVTLYSDTNGNGQINVGEPVVGTLTTDAAGQYVFSGLTNGNYIVSVPAQSGYNYTGTGGAADSDPGSAGIQRGVALAGTNQLGIDFGFQATTQRSVSGLLWIDTNQNGAVEGLESRISGVTVGLFNAAGTTQLASTTTNASGFYSFTGVASGNYVVRITDQYGVLTSFFPTYEVTGGLNGPFDGQESINLTSGNVSSLNFGYVPLVLTGSIGGTVYNDVNSSNTIDGGDTGLSGVTVRLYVDSNNNGVADPGEPLADTVTTNGTGAYQFTNVPAGNYVVVETDPSGFVSILDTFGANDNQIKVTITAGGNSIGNNFLDRNPGGTNPDFAVTKSMAFGASPCGIGCVIDFTIAVRNNGNGPGTVTITDTLPPQVTFQSFGTIGQGTPSHSAGVVTWNVGSLAVGVQVILVVKTTLNQLAPITNCASVSASNPADQNATNNTGCAYNVPEPVIVSDFKVTPDRSGAIVEWETGVEAGTVGFYLFRYDDEGKRYLPLTQQLLPAVDFAPGGARYRLVDDSAPKSGALKYLLVDAGTNGNQVPYGPIGFALGQPGSPAVPLAGFDLRPALFRSGIGSLSTINDPSTGEKVTLGAFDPRYVPPIGGRDSVSSFTGSAKPVSGTGKDKAEARPAAVTEVPAPEGIALSPPRLKLSVNADGLTFVETSRIATATGYSESAVKTYLSNGYFSLTKNGSQVAWFPAANLSGLYFYGQRAWGDYASENVYLLSRGRGTVMQSATLAPAGGPVPGAVFPSPLHQEEDLTPGLYTTDPRSGFWFWKRILAGSPSQGRVRFDFALPGLTQTGQANLHIRLNSQTETPAKMDHHVAIWVNGILAGQSHWDGARLQDVTLDLSAGILSEATNALEVEGMLDTGAPYSMMYVDSFDITYPRRYQAVSNSLLCTGAGNATVTVSGLTDSAIFALDVTDPLLPILVSNLAVTGTPGAYQASFSPASSSSVYLVTTLGAARTVASSRMTAGVDLTDLTEGADYIVITTPALIEPVRKLTAFRESTGLTTQIVFVDQIMDSFRGGNYDPYAIRDFLRFAYEKWTRKPRFVVLAGIGTYDYKNVQGFGGNLVPAVLMPASGVLGAADAMYADFDNDGIPDIPIGRLAASNASELEDTVAKIIAYERDPRPADTNRVVLAADTTDPSSGDFPAGCEEIADGLPSGTPAGKIYLDTLPIAAARTQLFQYMNAGSAFVNLAGHSSVIFFSRLQLLSVSDVPQIANAGRLPVVTAPTCFLNSFAFPGVNCLGRTLTLYPGSGAVAVFSSSVQSFDRQASYLATSFYNQVYQGGARTLGAAIQGALGQFIASGGTPSISRTYVLLGDPATVLQKGSN